MDTTAAERVRKAEAAVRTAVERLDTVRARTRRDPSLEHALETECRRRKARYRAALKAR